MKNTDKKSKIFNGVFLILGIISGVLLLYMGMTSINILSVAESSEDGLYALFVISSIGYILSGAISLAIMVLSYLVTDTVMTNINNVRRVRKYNYAIIVCAIIVSIIVGALLFISIVNYMLTLMALICVTMSFISLVVISVMSLNLVPHYNILGAISKKG